ncbi:hypothetical protein [Deinococcus sp.]|uniref:hypothetical protein n=1 Tax=Deinococcus sp. TaxID=47478 RepID=UPI003B58C190
MDDSLTVTTSAQARLLLSLRVGRVIGALLHVPDGQAPAGQSAAEVARAVDEPLSRVHRTLGHLLDAGLIVVSGTRRRAGRAVKLYAARAGEYLVPFHLSDAATLHEMMAALHQPFLEAYIHQEARLMVQQGRDTLRLRLDGHQLSYRIVEPNGQASQPDFYSFFAALNLTPAQAEAMQAELRQLEEKYGQSNPDGQPYLLGLLLSPGELES